MADWAYDAGNSAAAQAAAAVSAPVNDEIADRTNVITAKLKTIYRKHVYPVEKRYKYDYFYESPFLTDVELNVSSGILVEGKRPPGELQEVLERCPLILSLGLLNILLFAIVFLQHNAFMCT